eukprot:COSAG02_NODE_8129_length_2696_cov_1.713516_1_plen_79_part_10
MVRTKTVARKAGDGTVPAGVPTPTSPAVLTQDVQAAEAQATAAHVSGGRRNSSEMQYKQRMHSIVFESAAAAVRNSLLH